MIWDINCGVKTITENIVTFFITWIWGTIFREKKAFVCVYYNFIVPKRKNNNKS